jgi:NAD dependent epimerase/dehydratase
MSGTWNGRRVLVTGAGGFIGSHVAERLVHAGAHVRAMVRYTGRSDIGMLADLPPDTLDSLEVVHSDVTDAYAVHRAVQGSQVVFHLAALIGIPYSYTAPASYVATNTIGTLHILEAARTHDVARLVLTSTSEVYGTARYTPIDEQHPLQPQSPYSASKIAADCLAESYHRAFDLPVAIIRPFNTYGPRQSARAVIPTIATQLLAGAPRITLGSLHPVRDLAFVDDTVSGFLAVAGTDNCLGHVTNIGVGHGTSIGDLAELLSTISGRPDVDIVTDPQRLRPPASEVGTLIADPSTARDRCGWMPSVDLTEGLTRTVEYLRAHLNRFHPDRYAI